MPASTCTTRCVSPHLKRWNSETHVLSIDVRVHRFGRALRAARPSLPSVAAITTCCPQAYTTPPFFRDDWLNDYYDAKSRAASDTAAFATGVHSPHQPAAVRCVQRKGSDGAVLAAGDACNAAAATPDAAAGRTGDVAATPASCIATSDYRFVYLGPKVRPSSVLKSPALS